MGPYLGVEGSEGPYVGAVMGSGMECGAICGTVKSGNFVTFFAQNIFFSQNFMKVPYIFFSGSKFIKKVV